MSASLSGVFNLQEFTDPGAVGVGMRLYTYVSGTATFKAAYTDAAGLVPHTYTADGLGGQYIALNARGELPAPLFLAPGGYDLSLRRADGSTVWTRPAAGSADASNAISAALQSNTDPTQGAGQLGYDQAINYTAGLGLAMRQKLFAALAVRPGDLDFGVALNRVIAYAVQAYSQATIDLPAGASISIVTKVLIPTGIYLNLNGCRITGGGVGYASAMFETAYNNAGVITTNVGTTPQSHQVLNAGVIGNGATISNAGIVFNLQDTHDVCAFGGISFANCTQCVVSLYPFYASFFKMTSRGNASGSTMPAFSFTSFDNVLRLDEIFVNGRSGLAYYFNDGGYCLKMMGCSAESCGAGILFNGTVNSLALKSCYFESVTGAAIELSGPSSSFIGIDIDNNWFNICGKAIVAINFSGKWGQGNVLNTGANIVDFSDPSCRAEVEIAQNFAPDQLTAPSLPTQYSLGKGCVVKRTQVVYNSITGLPLVKAVDAGVGIVPLQYYGDSGDPNPNSAIFCTTSSSAPGTAPFNVIVDTNITFRSYTMLLAYSFSVVDSTGTYKLFGIVFGGTNAVAIDATGKTAVAQNNAGKLRLVFSTFSGTGGAFTCAGVVRHM